MIERGGGAALDDASSVLNVVSNTLDARYSHIDPEPEQAGSEPRRWTQVQDDLLALNCVMTAIKVNNSVTPRSLRAFLA